LIYQYVLKFQWLMIIIILIINSNFIGAKYDVFKAEENEILLKNGKKPKINNSTSLSLSILHLQSDSLSGVFDVPYKIRRYGIVSGSTLDFTCAKFTTKIVKIRTGKLVGKVKIIIPRGVCVEVFGSMSFLNSTPTRYGYFDLNIPYPTIQIKGATFPCDIHVVVNNNVPPLHLVEM